MELILLFLLGTCIGSFLNVVIDRLPHNQSIIRGRSWCDHCKKNLRWYDLIPVLSFVFLNGKCRYCHTPLSFQYPFVELLTGALFVSTFVILACPESVSGSILESSLDLLPRMTSCVNLLSIGLLYSLYIISSLIVIFFIDLKYGIIPDKIVFPAIFVSPFYVFFNHQSLFFNHLFSAFGALLFFLLIYLVTKGRGMGMGDVKFSFLMGLVLGFPGIVAGLYTAFLTGAFVSIILVLSGRKKLRGSTIPFGPFLVFGTLVAMFFGEKIFQSLFFYL